MSTAALKRVVGVLGPVSVAVVKQVGRLFVAEEHPSRVVVVLGSAFVDVGSQLLQSPA